MGVWVQVYYSGLELNIVLEVEKKLIFHAGLSDVKCINPNVKEMCYGEHILMISWILYRMNITTMSRTYSYFHSV